MSAFNDTQPSGAYPTATDSGPQMHHFNNSSINIRDKNAPLLTPLLAPTNYNHLGRGLLLFLPFRRRPNAEERSSHRLLRLFSLPKHHLYPGISCCSGSSRDLPWSLPTDDHLRFYRLCCIIFGNLLRFAVFGTVCAFLLKSLCADAFAKETAYALGFSLSDSGVFCCVHAGGLIETNLNPADKYLIKPLQDRFLRHFPNVPASAPSVSMRNENTAA